MRAAVVRVSKGPNLRFTILTVTTMLAAIYSILSFNDKALGPAPVALDTLGGLTLSEAPGIWKFPVISPKPTHFIFPARTCQPVKLSWLE